MIYLSGVTNDRDEPSLIASGVGLMIQPGNSYHLRVGRYPYWAADNGCLNPVTYVGHDRWLDWLAPLTPERCLFAVIPDVARQPDGSLGGNPVGTWALFEEFGPVVQSMGFPAALAAQDGIEQLPDLRDQLAACDVLFIAGSTNWKVGAGAEKVAGMARNLGKWVHMGRVNSLKRLKRARAMGCNSADGTYLKYRKRASGHGDPAQRGVGEFSEWYRVIDAQQELFVFEGASLPVHRDASEQVKRRQSWRTTEEGVA